MPVMCPQQELSSKTLTMTYLKGKSQLLAALEIHEVEVDKETLLKTIVSDIDCHTDGHNARSLEPTEQLSQIWT